MSFFVDKIVPGGLTLIDASLISSYSEVLQRQRGFTYWFTRCIRVNSPFDKATNISETPYYNSR